MDFSKSKYSEEHVTAKILNVMKALNLDRMPSRSEITSIDGDTSLTNIIMKTGGFYYWAEKMCLRIKKSETLTGITAEAECEKELNKLGFECDITPHRFPYDLLVNKTTKIDVKVSNGYEGFCFFFTFNLRYKLPKSDFYICYCINYRQTKTLIIPSHKLYGIAQLSVGLKSEYDIYIDRWDLIKKHCDYMETIK